MSLTPGQTLSGYEILGPLGAGGMGEVYRARDSRLGREVALKLLPPEMAGDAERMARFEREARVLASLQHPNIVTVHSIEDAEGRHFLTMELVEGATLAASIAEGGLPLDRFFPLAAALADALHAAHRKGITHRDLKPENVVVDASGRPKVLDFGLARIEEPSQLGEGKSSSLTGEGRAMGTIPYMSPEALKGEGVDSRSDVFALGVVLYELLTGAHPFPAADTGERISAILRDEPLPADEARAGVPPELARLLRRCLAKDPDRRVQTALDVRNELEELAAEPASGPVAGARPGAVAAAPGRRAVRLAGAGLGVGVLAVLGVAVARRLTPEPRPIFTTRPLTATSGLVVDPSWSPGAEFIAFGRHVAGSIDLFVKPVAGGEAVLRAGGPGDQHVPRWSPDGETLAFVSTLEPGTPVFLVPPHSGRARRLVDTNIPALSINTISAAMGDRPWSPDGRSLLVSRATETGQLAIFRVEVGGTRVEQLTSPPPGESDLCASHSFDGRRIAFARDREDVSSLWTMSASGADQEPLLEEPSLCWAPAWRPDGERVVFLSDRGGRTNDLWEIDLATGSLQQLTAETKGNFGHSVAQDGRIAYSSFWHDTFLFVVDVESGETRQLTDYTGNNYEARFSPDGKAIAYYSNRDGDEEIWVLDLEGGPERQITFDPGRDFSPDWSPDGERLVFVSTRGGVPALHVSNRDGGGQRRVMERTLPFGAVAQGMPGYVRWSPDGELLGFVVSAVGGQELWCVRPDGTDARRLVESVVGFDWYLDARRVVYTSSKGHADELYARHLETGETALLWKGKHTELDVSPDGASIVFCTGEGHHGMSLGRLPLEPPSGRDGLPAARASEPEILVQARNRWHAHRPSWSPDSKRVVYTHDEDYSDVYELVER